MSRLEQLPDWQYEIARYERLRAAEKELDERTDVYWEDSIGERCAHKTPAESSGRLRRCSNDATQIKIRLMPDGWKLPIGHFCDEHKGEH